MSGRYWMYHLYCCWCCGCNTCVFYLFSTRLYTHRTRLTFEQSLLEVEFPSRLFPLVHSSSVVSALRVSGVSFSSTCSANRRRGTRAEKKGKQSLMNPLPPSAAEEQIFGLFIFQTVTDAEKQKWLNVKNGNQLLPTKQTQKATALIVFESFFRQKYQNIVAASQSWIFIVFSLFYIIIK